MVKIKKIVSIFLLILILSICCFSVVVNATVYDDESTYSTDFVLGNFPTDIDDYAYHTLYVLNTGAMYVISWNTSGLYLYGNRSWAMPPDITTSGIIYTKNYDDNDWTLADSSESYGGLFYPVARYNISYICSNTVINDTYGSSPLIISNGCLNDWTELFLSDHNNLPVVSGNESTIDFTATNNILSNIYSYLKVVNASISNSSNNIITSLSFINNNMSSSFSALQTFLSSQYSFVIDSFHNDIVSLSTVLNDNYGSINSSISSSFSSFQDYLTIKFKSIMDKMSTLNGYLVNNLVDIVNALSYVIDYDLINFENDFNNFSSYFIITFDSFQTTLFDNLIMINTTIQTNFDTLFEKLDYYLNPENEQVKSETGGISGTAQTSIREKYNFVDDFQTQFSVLQNGNSAWCIDKIITVGTFNFPISINSNWFEPYRLYIRGGLSVLFALCTIIACIRLILGVFNIQLNVADGKVVADTSLNGPLSVNLGSKSFGNKKE